MIVHCPPFSGVNKSLHGDFLTPFQCSICFELYDRRNCIPVSFACGHSCCLKDAEKLDQCHICRGRIPSAGDLVPNFCLRDGAILMKELFWSSSSVHPFSQLELKPPRAVCVSETITLPSGLQRDIMIREWLLIKVAENTWDRFEFVLTSVSLLQLHIDNKFRTVVEEYVLHPNFSANKTEVPKFSFKLVTYSRVLHFQAETKNSAIRWLKVIRHVISSSLPSRYDLLLERCLLDGMSLDKSETDESLTYELALKEVKRTGLFLEKRTGEAPVVSAASCRTFPVHMDSALVAVNDVNILPMTYEEVVRIIRGWKPSQTLTLRFRRSPTKHGKLWKRMKNNHAWARHEFALENGFLTMTENDETTTTHMRTCVVSLLASADIGGENCFRVISAEENWVLKAKNKASMMEWAVALYNAATVANGSLYHMSSALA